jgi:hypothetical protein
MNSALDDEDMDAEAMELDTPRSTPRSAPSRPPSPEPAPAKHRRSFSDPATLATPPADAPALLLPRASTPSWSCPPSLRPLRPPPWTSPCPVHCYGTRENELEVLSIPPLRPRRAQPATFAKAFGESQPRLDRVTSGPSIHAYGTPASALRSSGFSFGSLPRSLAASGVSRTGLLIAPHASSPRRPRPSTPTPLTPTSARPRRPSTPSPPCLADDEPPMEPPQLPRFHARAPAWLQKPAPSRASGTVALTPVPRPMTAQYTAALRPHRPQPKLVPRANDAWAGALLGRGQPKSPSEVEAAFAL